ncbi:hypothetical protein ABGB12_08865 [Actinocorallia sp. B10E7]
MKRIKAAIVGLAAGAAVIAVPGTAHAASATTYLFTPNGAH